MEASVRKLIREKEELCRALEQQEEQASMTLQEETHKLRVQNQELQHKVPDTKRQTVLNSRTDPRKLRICLS